MPSSDPVPALDTRAPPAGPPRRGPSHPFAWTSSTYFAEGYPYTLVNQLPEILFKEAGASLEQIGLTTLLHVPWNLKFLWGPFLDRFGTKRKWLLWIELVMVGAILALAFTTAGGGSVLVASSVAFLVLAFLSATHDIAVDGYYLEALDDDDQSKYVGTRATAYRISMLAVAGPMVLLIGRVGWSTGFVVAAAVMALLFLYHARFLPRAEVEHRPIGALTGYLLRPRSLVWLAAAIALVAGARSLLSLEGVRSGPWKAWLGRIDLAGWAAIGLLVALLGALALLPWWRRSRAGRSDSFYSRAFLDFLDQPRIGVILAFVLFFRAGESFLLKMRYAFIRDLGITMEQYGFVSGTLGVIASFSGTILAGWLIARHGLKRWIWPGALAQNVLNLLYWYLALRYAHVLADGATGRASLVVVGTVIIIEAFGAGMGTAVLMVVLMRSCRKDNRAAHMAILTALMSVSFTLAGVASGFLAKALGFARYFLFTFLATLPAMAMVAFLPHTEKPPAPPAPAT